MNAPETQAVATRAVSLLASWAITALIVGSQLGIADGYTQQADAMLATKNAQQPIAQQAAPTAQPSS